MAEARPRIVQMPRNRPRCVARAPSLLQDRPMSSDERARPLAFHAGRGRPVYELGEGGTHRVRPALLIMAQTASLHGQIGFVPWPNRLRSMAQTASFHGQTGFAPWPKRSIGVITVMFWRQFNTILASKQQSIDANTHDWPQAESAWPQAGICLATGGKWVGHRRDRALIGVGRDLGTLRKGSVPLTERFGVLSPRASSQSPCLAQQADTPTADRLPPVPSGTR